jgi:hypothetical protein
MILRNILRVPLCFLLGFSTSLVWIHGNLLVAAICLSVATLIVIFWPLLETLE